MPYTTYHLHNECHVSDGIGVEQLSLLDVLESCDGSYVHLGSIVYICFCVNALHLPKKSRLSPNQRTNERLHLNWYSNEFSSSTYNYFLIKHFHCLQRNTHLNSGASMPAACSVLCAGATIQDIIIVFSTSLPLSSLFYCSILRWQH